MTVRAERPAPNGAGMAALLGLAAGAAALTLVHPVAMLADPGALPAPPGDWAMTLSGARAFVTDAWRWPVFAFEGLSSVHPTNAVFLDAIPLYALAWKALAHPAGVAFAWFLPVWLALLFLFQGAAGAVALRLAGVGARGPLIAGAFLMALMPVFLFRQIGHLALSAHGFVLLALGLLLAGPGVWRAPWRGFAAWGGLLAAAVLTHPYLFGMAGVAFLAWLATGLRLPRAEGGIGPGGALRAAGAVAAGVAAVMGAAGHFAGPAPGAGGFGHFSASLAAPVMHANTSLLPLGLWYAPGQHEGYAYVPLGVWALIALALALVLLGRGAAHGPAAARARALAPVLAAGAVAVCLFATAGRFTWGATELGELALPNWLRDIGAIFRASGRFLWLVVYGAALLALVRIARALPARWAGAAVALAALAVTVEMTPLRGRVPPPEGAVSGDPVLQAAFAGAERAAIAPPWPCGDRDSDYKELQWLAARSGVVLDQSLAAARLAVDCAQALPAAYRGALAPGRLLVIATNRASMAEVLATGAAPRGCGAHGGFILCRADWAGAAGLPAGLAPLDPPARTPVGRYPTRGGAAGVDLLGRGFSNPQGWGVWSVGEAAVIDIFPAEGARAGSLRLRLRGFVPSARPRTGAEVTLRWKGGLSEAGWRAGATTRVAFDRAAPAHTVALSMPGPEAAWLRVTIRPDAPVTPDSLGVNADRRPLGVGLLWLALE